MHLGLSLGHIGIANLDLLLDGGDRLYGKLRNNIKQLKLMLYMYNFRVLSISNTTSPLVADHHHTHI